VRGNTLKQCCAYVRLYESKCGNLQSAPKEFTCRHSGKNLKRNGIFPEPIFKMVYIFISVAHLSAKSAQLRNKYLKEKICDISL
jgi:protoporphyrinogen oxidase